MNRTEADRKVAADYIEKQYQKVKRSLDGLVEISNSRDPRILSVQVIGNGDHTYYSLPPSYNRELGKRITWLGARNSSCVCLIAGNGGKYDNYHLHDHQYNRKLLYRFLRGAITFDLKFVEIMTKREQLQRFAVNFIENDHDRREAVRLFLTIIQFRLALPEPRKSCWLCSWPPPRRPGLRLRNSTRPRGDLDVGSCWDS